MLNHLGLSARQLANEWEAHALNRGADDASQALLTLSSLGALEAVLNKRATIGSGDNTPAHALAKVREGVRVLLLSSSQPSPYPDLAPQPSTPNHPNHSVAGRTRR
jgi:hypothetical protein